MIAENLDLRSLSAGRLRCLIHELVDQIADRPASRHDLRPMLTRAIEAWLARVGEDAAEGEGGAALDDAGSWEREADEGFRRDLPVLLRSARRSRPWVLYHGARQVRLGATKTELLQHASASGLPEHQVSVRFISAAPVPTSLDDLPDV